MTREELKYMAAGKFAMMNIEGTINKNEMRTFIEGALVGFDLCQREASTFKIENTDAPRQRIDHMPHRVAQ